MKPRVCNVIKHKLARNNPERTLAPRNVEVALIFWQRVNKTKAMNEDGTLISMLTLLRQMTQPCEILG